MRFNDDAMNLREGIRLLERKLGILGKTDASCCGVTFAQCHAIVEIGRAKSLSLNELAQMLNLDNSTMSRTVNNLVNSRLAERNSDPADRRYVTIRLTLDGEKVFQSIEERMNLYYKKVFDRMPAEKRSQVIESLGILMEAMNEKDCCD